MNKQEIFDTVAKHLLTQNKKSQNEYGRCLYRFGTLKCAAGCLITDEEYLPEMENSFVFSILESKTCPATLSTRLLKEKSILNELQTIHDCKSVFSWKFELKKLASELELDFSVCDQF